MIFDGHSGRIPRIKVFDWNSEDLSAFGGFLKPQMALSACHCGDPENW
jgi:hypothetical protein